MLLPYPKYGEDLAHYMTRLEAEVAYLRAWGVLVGAVLVALAVPPLLLLQLAPLTPPSWPTGARVAAVVAGVVVAGWTVNRIIRRLSRRIANPPRERGLFGEERGEL